MRGIQARISQYKPLLETVESQSRNCYKEKNVGNDYGGKRYPLVNLTTSEGVKEDMAKVLIVDDAAFMRLRVANLLKGKGYTVIEAYQVLESEVGAKIEKGRLTLQESRFTGHDITVMIGVTGQLRGIVIYSMNEETARSLLEVMLGQPVEEFDSLAESGIGELGNIITGLAGSNLRD